MKRYSLKILLLALALAIPGWLHAEQDQSSKSTNLASANVDGKFRFLYPGRYTEREQALVKKYLDDNAALRARGPIDVSRLVKGELPKDTPGIGTVIKVTEEWLRYQAKRVDPENPLRSDKGYAIRSGFADILAFPTFGAHDDTFMVPFPPPARDTLLVSDLNHSVTSLKPIYPGDTLFLVADEREVIDLTPPQGSVYRSVAINTKGSVYNQRGEKVNEVVFRVTESLKQYTNASDAPKNPGFFDMWEAPNWLNRPAHVYNDADWSRIRSIWKSERRQGSTPLYWDDVVVGSAPQPTIDGPILASVQPVAPWGMGSGGSRSLKQEILSDDTRSSLIRGAKDGIYRTAQREGYIPSVPAQENAKNGVLPSQNDGGIVTTDIHKDGEERSPLVNYMGRDYAIRHLDNWMGDAGWLHNIRWSIMDPRGHSKYGKPVPENPRAEHFLEKLVKWIPSMKDRFVQTHGLTQDVAHVQSRVVDKKIVDGQALVELVWWIQTLDGQIWEEGAASVRLPRKPLK